MKKRVIALSLALLFAAFCLVSCQNLPDSGNDPTPGIAEADVDLTLLSEAEQYAKSLEITQNFDDYVGKTVRVSGTYQEQTYHFIIIYDGTCCTNFFEFLYSGEMPAAGDAIELTGTFGYYSDDAGSYPYIDVKELLII